jgi:conjugal transfer pilus assembly protein TraW
MFAMVICEPGIALDLGKHGPTYAITETDFIDQITAVAKRKVASGEWKQVEKKAQQDFLKKLDAMDSGRTFTVAAQLRAWHHDPSIELQQAIVDEHGRVIHPVGTRVNPLDVLPLSEPFIFIDGRDARQVSLAERLQQKASGNLKVILVAGNYLTLATRWKTAIYFDQAALMTAQLGITVVPALVSQDNRLLKIEELVP